MFPKFYPQKITQKMEVRDDLSADLNMVKKNLDFNIPFSTYIDVLCMLIIPNTDSNIIHCFIAKAALIRVSFILYLNCINFCFKLY